MTIRKQMGLPSGWQWCTVHKKGTHYDHLCRRHSPNVPPVPKINPTAPVCTPVRDQLPERVLTMLGISTQTPQPLQQQQQNKRQSITITRPNDNPQNFQTAHNISINVRCRAGTAGCEHPRVHLEHGFNATRRSISRTLKSGILRRGRGATSTSTYDNSSTTSSLIGKSTTENELHFPFIRSWSC